MLCLAVGGLLKICMLIYQALPRRMHISFFGKAYVMYRPDLVLVHENPPHWGLVNVDVHWWSLPCLVLPLV